MEGDVKGRYEEKTQPALTDHWDTYCFAMLADYVPQDEGLASKTKRRLMKLWHGLMNEICSNKLFFLTTDVTLSLTSWP